MNTPLWQFWTDWAVKAVSALATFLAVIVALFGSRLRHWMIPARLKIELSTTRGVKGALYELDDTTKQARHLTDSLTI